MLTREKIMRCLKLLGEELKCSLRSARYRVYVGKWLRVILTFNHFSLYLCGFLFSALS